MRKLDKINKNIRSYLMKTSYEKWTRVHSKDNKYSILTSNIAESMKVANKAARDLPIATLVECFRCLVQKWHWKYKQDATFTRTELAPKPINMLKDNYVTGLRMQVCDFDIIKIVNNLTCCLTLSTRLLLW